MATSTAVLHQFEMSPFCDKVRRALRYKGVPFTVREWGLVQLGRPAKLPVLEIHGKKIHDSTDILEYLEAAFPDRPPLFLADPAQRAQCHILEDWADEGLYFHEMRLRFTEGANPAKLLPRLLENDAWFFRTALGRYLVQSNIQSTINTQGIGRRPRDAHRKMLRGAVHAVSDLLAANGDYLVGTHLTHADLAVYAQFFCIFMTPEGAAILHDFPLVARFQERVARLTDPSPPSKL